MKERQGLLTMTKLFLREVMNQFANEQINKLSIQYSTRYGNQQQLYVWYQNLGYFGQKSRNQNIRKYNKSSVIPTNATATTKATVAKLGTDLSQLKSTIDSKDPYDKVSGLVQRTIYPDLDAAFRLKQNRYSHLLFFYG